MLLTGATCAMFDLFDLYFSSSQRHEDRLQSHLQRTVGVASGLFITMFPEWHTLHGRITLPNQLIGRCVTGRTDLADGRRMDLTSLVAEQASGGSANTELFLRAEDRRTSAPVRS